MPRIFDNQNLPLGPALRQAMGEAVALDACVGYLNLRGWRVIADEVDALETGLRDPPVRALVGMAARPDQLVRSSYRVRREGEDDRVTLKEARRLQVEALTDFRRQLTIGTPSDRDEK